MEKKTFKKVGKGIASTIFASFLILSTTTVSDAAVVSKKVETESKIKILNNNVLVPGNIGPIVIDGTTYLPVRSLAGALNKKINWDGTTKSIYITDTINPDELKNEISNLEKFIKTKDAKITELENANKTKDTKITELENANKTKDAKIIELENANKTKDAKIAELEKLLKSNSNSTVSLKDLQTQLNKDYKNWNDMEFNIVLKGDVNDIVVEIEINLNKASYYRDWYKLSSAKIERFINNIADDIWAKYKNVEIIGEVIDIHENDTLVVFSGKDKELKRIRIYEEN